MNNVSENISRSICDLITYCAICKGKLDYTLEETDHSLIAKCCDIQTTLKLNVKYERKIISITNEGAIKSG